MPKKTARRIIDTRKDTGTTILTGVTVSGSPGSGASAAMAGDGLTYSSGVLNVGAGTLITVGADSVGITAGSTYQFVGTGAGTAAAWQNLSGLAGAGLTHSAGVLAVGAGNGITVNADDVALTTPGTLTVSTSNSASGSHTHAITSSSNPGANARLLASTASGGLTLQSLSVQGSVDVTNGGDLTVAGSGSYAGSNVLFVDSSGGNVGIMGAPDPQFALDVVGPCRATWFVGPHAIQLKNVILLSHFDGKLPFETNYTGEPNDIMGKVAAVAGGAIFRPGKFGTKALQIAESGYNYCPNPSAETDASGWQTHYNDGRLTSQARSTEQALYGSYSIKMTNSTATTYVFNSPHFDAPSSVVMTWNNTETATLSCYVRGSGTWRVAFQDAGQNLRAYSEVVLSSSGDWQRVVITATNSSGSNYASVNLAFFPMSASATIYVDGLHYEKTARATAYLDSSLSNGLNSEHGTLGTAPNQYSFRNGAGLYYSQAMPAKWSVMFWAYRAAWQAYSFGYMLSWGNVGFYYNSSNQDVLFGQTASAPTTGWHHYAAIYDGTTTKVYRDGAYVGSSASAVGTPTVIYVGYNGAGSQFNGLVDDLVILDRAMVIETDNTCDELRTVYESDAPVFAESSRFSFRATPQGLVWADDEGLWMRNSTGGTVLGAYGGAATKSWGGLTLSPSDVVIGDSSRGSYAWWDDSAGAFAIGKGGTDRITLSSAGVLSIKDSGGAAVFTFNASAGAEFTKPLTIGTSGGIYQGSGTFASPTTGLKIWNDSGVGRIGGYNSGALQWYASTDGYLYGGDGSTNRYRLGSDSFRGIISTSATEYPIVFLDTITASDWTAESLTGIVATSKVTTSGSEQVNAFIRSRVKGSTARTTYTAKTTLIAHVDNGSGGWNQSALEVVTVRNGGARYMAYAGDYFYIDGYMWFKPITAPGTPATGVVLYCDTSDGRLKAKNTAGTVTNIT